MTGKGGEDHSDFDHPWNRSPEISKKLQEGVNFLFGKLIVAELKKAPPGFRIGKPFGRISYLLFKRIEGSFCTIRCILRNCR